MEDIRVTIAPKAPAASTDNVPPGEQTPATPAAALETTPAPVATGTPAATVPLTPADAIPPTTPATVATDATPATPATPAAVTAPAEPAPPALTEDEQKVLAAFKSGKLPEYLEISRRDYRAMSDEDVFKTQIRKEHPGAPERYIQNQLEKRLEKYDFGDDEEAKEEGVKYRKLEADQVRDVLEAEQKEFAVSVAPAAAAPQASSEQIQEQQKELKEINDYLEGHPVLTAFEMNPVIKVGESGEFTYKVDSSSLNRKSLLFPERPIDLLFWSTDATGKRSFDMEGYIATRNYATNRKAFEQALIEAGKSLNAKSEFDSRVNPRTELNAAAPAASQGSKPKVSII